MDPPNLVLYNRNAQYYQVYTTTRTRYSTVALPYSPFAMAVYIDGACRGNGRPNAIASYGVYFGPNSRLNRWGRVRPDRPQTSIRAEIEALWEALVAINDEHERGFMHQSNIVIFMDSKYLYDTMTTWLSIWKDNGGYTSHGVRVLNFSRLMEIDEFCDFFAWKGVFITFEHIGREHNQGADRLANLALHN